MFLILIYIFHCLFSKNINPLQELVSVRAKEKVFRSKKCSTVSERYSPIKYWQHSTNRQCNGEIGVPAVIEWKILLGLSANWR